MLIIYRVIIVLGCCGIVMYSMRALWIIARLFYIYILTIKSSLSNYPLFLTKINFLDLFSIDLVYMIFDRVIVNK